MKGIHFRKNGDLGKGVLGGKSCSKKTPDKIGKEINTTTEKGYEEMLKTSR